MPIVIVNPPAIRSSIHIFNAPSAKSAAPIARVTASPPTEPRSPTHCGAVIKSVRDGRKVVGYELVNIDEMKKLIASGAFASSATKAVAKPKTTTVKTAVAKTAKAAKPVKAKKVTPVPVRAGDSLDGIMSAMAKSSAKKPVNLLDEIDTDVEDFEDRQFAEAYIRT